MNLLVINGAVMNGTGTSPPTSALIRGALADYLLGDPGVAAVVGVRVFPLTKGEGYAAPALVYRLFNVDRQRSLDGPTGNATATVELTCVTKTLADGEDLAEAARQAMDGLTNVQLPGGVRVVDCYLDGEGDDARDLADGTARPLADTTVRYVIWYREPRPTRFG